MKRITKFIGVTLLAIVLVISYFSPICVQAAQKIKISKSKITIKEDKKTYLSLIIDGVQLIDDGYEVKWSSSNKNVVTVNRYGRIKGISKGSATISAKYNKKTYKCKVTVNPKTTKSAFSADKARENITFTPIETCENLYEITSTYDFPTLIVANYKIVDSEGVTVSKSAIYVIAVPWDKTYLRTPLLVNNNQTVQMTYEYKEYKGKLTKEKWNKTKNSIEICKYEQDSSKFNSYNVYIKNISNEKYRPANVYSLCAYDRNGNIVGFEENLPIHEMDINEIISFSYLYFIGANDICDIQLHIQYY